MSMRFTFSAPGKIILFGEHAVVYGYSAVSTAISKRMKACCSVNTSISPEVRVNFHDKVVSFNPNDEKIDNNKPVYRMIHSAFHGKVSKNISINIDITEEFPSGNGLGSSASLCSVIAAAVDRICGKDLDYDDLFLKATSLEKFFHGNPSGIDPATVIYGNGIHMKNRKVNRISLPSIPMLIVDTGRIHATSEAVMHVKSLNTQYPSVFSKMLETMGSITDTFLNLSKEDQIKSIPSLFPAANSLLCGFGLNCVESDCIDRIAKSNGLFSKISGAGMGGIVLVSGNDVLSKGGLFKDYNVVLASIGERGLIEE